MALSIGEWLNSNGFGEYAEAFSTEHVDFDVLDQLTENHLKELGMSLGNRLRLLKLIEAESDQTNHPAVPALTVPRSTNLSAAKNPLPPETHNEAERRPLTVMFCDLADSTALSTQLDPEDLQDIIRAYQESCTQQIQNYEGYVAKYMGDGILVYFGYPKSLERNAERAVLTALEIVEAIGTLNRTLGAEKGVEIAVRIGIATGIVIVGEVIGKGMAQERTVIGEAPNMAARLPGRCHP